MPDSHQNASHSADMLYKEIVIFINSRYNNDVRHIILKPKTWQDETVRGKAALG